MNTDDLTTENTVIAKRFYRSNLFAYMSKASLKKGDSRLKEKPLTFDQQNNGRHGKHGISFAP